MDPDADGVGIIWEGVGIWGEGVGMMWEGGGAEGGGIMTLEGWGVAAACDAADMGPPCCYGNRVHTNEIARHYNNNYMQFNIVGNRIKLNNNN